MEAGTHEAVTPHPALQRALVTFILPSVCLDVRVLGSSRKWTHSICPRMSVSIWRNVLSVRSRKGTSLLCGVRPHFVYLVISGTLGMCPIWGLLGIMLL